MFVSFSISQSNVNHLPPRMKGLALARRTAASKSSENFAGSLANRVLHFSFRDSVRSRASGSGPRSRFHASKSERAVGGFGAGGSASADKLPVREAVFVFIVGLGWGGEALPSHCVGIADAFFFFFSFSAFHLFSAASLAN